VDEYHRRRKLMRTGREIARIAGELTDPAEQLDRAQSLLVKLGTTKAQCDPRTISDSLADYLQLLDDLSQGRNPALPTGLEGLDKLLNGGLRRGEMMVIGARPKHGKTALALAVARAMSRNFSVLYLSQEMPVNQLMHRHTAAEGGVDLGRILRADPADVDMWASVTDAAQTLGRLRLLHDDQCSLSLLDVRRKAMKVRREHGLDVLVVDFLQLMAGAAGSESRNRELDVLANGLKALAMELGIAVITLSQMSRKADETLARPTMTHLRDSGAIEAAADQIALIFTDHAHPLSKRDPAFADYMVLEIVAHRNGAQGLVHLQFDGSRQRIADWPGAPPKRDAATATKVVARGMPAFTSKRVVEDNY
jgi:replicative DNA helicase